MLLKLLIPGPDLALAFTGVSRNIMFHVVSILFILALTGVFCHQFIRMLMMMRRPPRKARHYRTAHRSRRRHAGRQGQHNNRRHDRDGHGAQAELDDDMFTEKPIQIHMASDAGFGPDVEMAEAETGGDDQHPAIRPPPPVYGNTRTSMVSIFV